MIHIGPIWDSDMSFQTFKRTGMNATIDYTLNTERYRVDDKNDWYKQLYRNKEFVKLLNQMYQEKIYDVYSRASNIIDEYVNGMQQSIHMNLIRWYKNEMNMDDYYNQIQFLKEFVQTRAEYFNKRYSIDADIIYTTFVKSEGEDNGYWERTWKMDGETSGIQEVQNPIMQDIKITLANSEKNQNVKYNIHTYGKGWLGWQYNGNDFGTVNEKNIDAIKIELEGMPKHKVAYRVYMKDTGWQEWKYDGEVAGIIGEGQIMQGIEIKLEEE